MLISAAFLISLAIASAAQDDRWDKVKRELQSFAQDTLPKWGIKISMEGKGEEEGQAAFFPSRFKVTGGYETRDTIRMSVETGLGRSNSLSVGFQGAFKSDPNSTDLSGAGTLSLPGGSSMKFKYTQDKGFELDVKADQQYTFVGVQIGDPKKNPFEFGFKVGPASIRIDPVAYVKRFRAFAPNAVKAIEDKVGGVYINFDLGLLAMAMADAPPEHVKQFSEVSFVSLKRLLATEGATDLGPVTAIHGFILDPSERDVLLVGKEEEGAPRISVDVLVALLRSVWRDGLSPAVSIDPTDKAGDDHVPRFHGVSSGLEESSLLRILFDADYAMKRHMVDTEIPQVFSVPDRFRRRTSEQAGEPTPTRFWFHPRPLASGDIWRVGGKEGAVYLYETGVQLSAEATSLDGRACPIYEEFVQDVTARFASFERAYPVYKQLRQIFELSLACTLLRAASGEEPIRTLLGKLGERAVSQDPHRKTFPACLMEMKTSDGYTRTIRGGIETRRRADRQRQVVVKELEELLARVRTLKWDGSCARLHGAFQPIIRESEFAYRCALADAILIEAESEEELGRKDEALAKVSRAIEIDPEFGAAFVFRAQLMLHLAKPQEALKDAEQALRLASEDNWSYVVRGTARMYLKDLDGALADAGLALERDPAWGVARYLRAMALFHKKDLDGAIAEYTRLIEQRPAFAQLFVDRADVRIAKVDIAGAIEDYGRAIDLDPKRPLAYCRRGHAKSLSADFDGAVEDFTRAIELDPKCAEAYGLLGTVKQIVRKDFQGAIQDYNRAIDLEPGRAGNYCLRGEARYQLKDVDGALQDLDKALELDPAFPRAFHFRGRVRYDKGDFDGAIANLTRAIELEPSNAETWFLRGRAKSAKKDHEEAGRDYAEAIKLAPETGGGLTPMFNELVEAHSNQRYAVSAVGFEELYWALPKDSIGARAAYNVACANALLGKRAEALDWLERAVEAGCKDVEVMAKDPDLESLREEPRFKRVIEKLKGGK